MRFDSLFEKMSKVQTPGIDAPVKEESKFKAAEEALIQERSGKYTIEPIKDDGSLDAKRVGDKSYPHQNLTDQQVWDWYFKNNPEGDSASKEQLQAFLKKNRLRMRPVTWESKETVTEQDEERPKEPIVADGEDIVLIVMNDQPIYKQFMMAVQNLKRKKAKGNYDHDLAVKMMLYPAKAGAQKWYQETARYYDDSTPVTKPSSQAIQQAAVQLRDEFEEEYAATKYE